MIKNNSSAPKTVSIHSIHALRANNIFAYSPVLSVIMDIGELRELPSSEFPGFTERLVDWLPGLRRHECSVGRPGGFIERLRKGTYIAHIVEHITIELQNRMGFDVSYGRARNAGAPSLYSVVIEYEEEQPAREAFAVAVRLTLAAMYNEPFDINTEIDKLQTLAERYKLGPTTAAIVRAARRRRIPVTRLHPENSLVQLSYGIYQKRIMASQTTKTSQIAVTMCQEKPLTNRMLKSVGVPVPEGRTVKSADEAWEAAKNIGLPVVVKPVAGNQGKGVAINLKSEDEVRQAFQIAAEFDKEVLVEEFLKGIDYRLLVINGKVVAAAKREPAHVIGDGHSTVEALVKAANRDPHRRPGHGGTMSTIVLNEASDLVLKAQNLTRTSIPEAKQFVRLRSNANLSTGGSATDVTNEVHPRNARLAALAAQIMDLDVAGLDIVCEDINRPLDEQGGAIVEVNAAPGLRMHLSPSNGTPRDVAAPIIDMLFPQDSEVEIPIVTVTGTNGKTTVTRLIAHIFKTAHRIVGMTCTDGVYIDDQRIVLGDCAGPKSAEAVLLHPNVEVAVLEAARGGILREGLGYDRCSVGVVTNISSDHLGQDGVNSLEELAKVKQVVIDAVDRHGVAVLNADDNLVASMAADTDAEVIYFSADQESSIIQAHARDGKRCVTMKNASIVLIDGDTEEELCEISSIQFTLGGKIGFQVLNALAATAAAWGADVNPAYINRALTTFKTDFAAAPGRFNVTTIDGVEVVLDYGHNAAAMMALGEAILQMEKRKTIMAISLPGDRRNEDLVNTVLATTTFVNSYVIYHSGELRGRKEGEFLSLVKSSLPPHVSIASAEDQSDALHKAWNLVRPGDRLVLIPDAVDEAIEMIESFSSQADDEKICESPLGTSRFH